TRQEIFCFRKAAELRTSQVRRYYNGVYQGTSYTFTWTNDDGRTAYVISGTHNSERGMPAPKDPYHFAVASELAWSNYRLDQLQQELDEYGSIQFSLEGSNWVRIGRGFLELNMRGETIRCDTNEIDRIILNQGIFTIKRTDAREGWFTSRGVFKFNYNALANAQLFAFVLKRLVGVPIT